MTESAMIPDRAPKIADAMRFLLIAVIAFLTLVDLFATQVIISGLTARYDVSPATMGAAVSACTFGMAAASLLVALFSDRIDRRAGIIASLAILSVPTVLLAWAPTVAVFATLRIVQGLCMATAFSLTLAYLGERMTGSAASRAFGAYVTGNVASNLVGRFVASGVASEWGINASFYVFAGLNLVGAVLVAATIHRPEKMKLGVDHARAPLTAVMTHLANPRLRAAASGLYLANYFSGGLVGAVVLGQVYTRYGWHAMLAAVLLVLAIAAVLARNFDLPMPNADVDSKKP